ncbi:MAG: leucine-rich repeat domain-containing protein [Clostridiales bacterium]|nr:leucine-rich repeat domain-containing protein [Clostridiales bacterium]
MKKTIGILALLLIAVLVISLCACGSVGKSGTTEESENGETGGNETQNEPDISTEGSKGFDFDAVYDEITGKTGYCIIGTGSCEDEDVIVPQGRTNYLGETQPYLWDDNNGFRGMQNAKSITLPEGFLEINSGFGYSPLLEKVVIPSTVRKIGYNGDSRIFEYCPQFKEIVYNGTVEQWNAIEKEENWKTGTEGFTVHCTDGDVSE